MRLPLHRFLCRWLVCSWLGHNTFANETERDGVVRRNRVCFACLTCVGETVVDTLGDARCASGEEVVRR